MRKIWKIKIYENLEKASVVENSTKNREESFETSLSIITNQLQNTDACYLRYHYNYPQIEEILLA